MARGGVAARGGVWRRALARSYLDHIRDEDGAPLVELDALDERDGAAALGHGVHLRADAPGAQKCPQPCGLSRRRVAALAQRVAAIPQRVAALAQRVAAISQRVAAIAEGVAEAAR